LVKKLHIWGGHAPSWWMRMAETGFIGWIPEIRNIMIFKSPGHLVGGAKDKYKYRKMYYVFDKYLIW
jgi:hypothetical protein